MFSFFYKEKITKNSFFLILSTAIMGGFGFFFWFINTHLFTPDQIGIATLLISAMNLIALLSRAGLDSVLTRFLWHSNKRNEKINTATTLVGVIAAILASCFILALSFIAPKLLFMHKNFWLMAGFVIYCVTASWNALTDAVFLAYRKPIYTLVINAVFSFEKMLLPFVFFALGANGIFAAAGLAGLTGYVISIWVLVKKFDYRPKIMIDRKVLREVKEYSVVNYFVELSNLLPPTVIPFVIASYLGVQKAAYFYIAFQVVNLLYSIPFSVGKTLLSEGAHTRDHLRAHIKNAIRFVSFLMIPAIIFFVIASPFLLRLFGKSYAGDAVGLLRIMSITGIAISSESLIISVFEVSKQLKPLLIISITRTITIIVGSIAALHFGFGLSGIGWAWFIGTIISSLVGFVWVYSYNLIDTDNIDLSAS